MAAGDSIWKYSVLGLARSVVTGGLLLVIALLRRQGILAATELTTQLKDRLIGSRWSLCLLFVALYAVGLLGALLFPDPEVLRAGALGWLGALFVNGVISFMVANFFCVPAVMAMTTEISSMRVSQELDVLEVMGFDPVDVVFVPKATAMFLAAPFYGVAVFAIGLPALWLGSHSQLELGFLAFCAEFTARLHSEAYLRILFKIMVCAFCLAVVAGMAGFWPRRRESRNFVGKLTAFALTTANLTVILINLLFAEIDH